MRTLVAAGCSPKSMQVKTKHSIPRRYVPLPLRSLFVSCLGAELHVPMLAPLPWKLLIYKTGFNYPLDKKSHCSGCL